MDIQELPLLEVVIDDAKLYFDAVYTQQWLDIVEKAKLDVVNKWNHFLGHLRRVENLTFKGESVTVEMIRAFKLPVPFVANLYNEWQKAVVKALGGNTEADSKKEGADSSGS